MQIINDNNLRILVPDKGYILVNKLSGVESKKFYLGKHDNESNYTEVPDPDFKYEESDSMNIVYETIDELITILNPVIASMPSTLESIDGENDGVNPFIKRIAIFYDEMIKRGLILKEAVPEPYKWYIKD